MRANPLQGPAKAGVMIRETALANSRYVDVIGSPSKRVAMEYRGAGQPQHGRRHHRRLRRRDVLATAIRSGT
jgi:hypothetical protein